MKIEGNSTLQAQAMHQLQQQCLQKKNTAVGRKTQDEAPATIAKGNSGQVQDSSGQSQGALRLMQEGHFKGVADLRLRINFADQLQEPPPLGEASSKGAAYNRFLEMYQQLSDIGSKGEESTPETGIEIAV